MKTSVIWGRKQISDPGGTEQFHQNQQKQATPRRIIIKFAKYNNKEKILKVARQKKSLTYKGGLIRIAADLSTEIWQATREWHNIFNMLREKYAAKNTLSRKDIIQNRRRYKEFPRQTKTKGVCDH